MKHGSWISSMTSLAFIAFGLTAGAHAESHSAKIVGYAPTKYSITESEALTRQLTDIENRIKAEVSQHKESVTLDVTVLGSADRTGNDGVNQDLGSKRAAEVQTSLIRDFGHLPNAAVHVYQQTNGSGWNERSVMVSWTVAPVAAQQRSRSWPWLLGLVIFLPVLVITVIFMGRRAAQAKAATDERKTVSIEFQYDGKQCVTYAERKGDELHTRLPLPPDKNGNRRDGVIIRKDSRGLVSSIRGLAKNEQYRITFEQLIAEGIIRVKGGL